VKIVRSVLGVLVGFGIFLVFVQMMSAFTGILTAGNNPAPGNYLLLSVTWTIAAAVISGYITARIAGAHEFPHAAVVGLLMIGMSVLSMRAEGASQPGWYQIAIGGCGPISVMIGAAIRLLAKPRQDSSAANSNTSGAASRR
jgi:hypothetical protein